MTIPWSTDPDVARLRTLALDRLTFAGDRWMGVEDVARAIRMRGDAVGDEEDLRYALAELVGAGQIEHLRRPSDDEDVYRARQQDGDITQRVRVLEAELQHAVKRIAELEREVEHLTTPRSG